MEALCFELLLKDLKTKKTFQTIVESTYPKRPVTQDRDEDNGQEELLSSLKDQSRSPEVNICKSFLRNMRALNSECNENISAILEEITFTEKSDMVVFCQALFLNSLMKSELTGDKLKVIEKILILYFDYENKRELENITISALPEDLCKSAKDVMEQELAIDPDIVPEIDAFAMCCSSAALIVLQLEDKSNEIQLSSENGLPIIVVQIAKLVESLQKLIFTETVQLFNNKPHFAKLNVKWIIWLSKVCSCLGVVENIVQSNEALKKLIMEASNFSILNNIVWLFGFCLDNLFHNPNLLLSNSCDQELAAKAKRVLETSIISLLKVLFYFMHVKNENNDQFGSRLMQKIMLCLFEVNESSLNERFQIQVIGFDTLILIIDNKWLSIKEFCEVMLMKILLKKKQCTIVNRLVKILLKTLKKVKDLDDVPMRMLENCPSSLDQVDVIGLRHMEVTIVAAYCAILLGLYCHSAEAFKSDIYAQISPVYMKACVNVMKKFKEFMRLLDILNPVGKKYVELAIEVFDELLPPSSSDQEHNNTAE